MDTSMASGPSAERDIIPFPEIKAFLHGRGINPSSRVSLRARLTRVSDGEGDARRKAGLIECNESFLLRPQLVQGLSTARGGQVAGVWGGTSEPRGDVFAGPTGHTA